MVWPSSAASKIRGPENAALVPDMSREELAETGLLQGSVPGLVNEEWKAGSAMPQPNLTVWYNTRCPVCDAGINRQRNKLIGLVKAGTIEFRDINLQPEALSRYGASLDDIRRRLHATDDAGRLLVGADVAIALWRLTPGEGWLATLLGNSLTRPVTRFAYDRFANALYAWNRRKRRW
jgi:predicted DCC family thiol-disulfide oxidoreductase YuxK